MQRYLDQYEQTSSERRRIEQLAEIRRENAALSDVIMSSGTGGDNDLPSYLDLRELQVLNALRTSQDVISRPAYSALVNTIRLDRELSSRPRSIQYRPSDLGGRRSGLAQDDDFPALTRSRANADGGSDDLDERFRIIRDYIRRPLGSHSGSDSERTIQSVRSLLYSGRRDTPLTLTNTEIENLLDQASAGEQSRRNTSDSAPSPRATVPPLPRDSFTGPSSASSSARRRQQLERIHANHRASASSARDAATPPQPSSGSSSGSSGSTARDAWTAHRTATTTAAAAAAAALDPALGSTSSGNRPASAAAAAGSTRADLRAARESLARQARAERANAPHAHVHAHANAAAVAAAAAIRSGVGDAAYGVLTAGLAWSEDGARLWVGCEEGIWEFDVDVKGRMGLSAVELR